MVYIVYHFFFFFGCWFPGHNVQFVKIYKVVHSGTVSKLYLSKIFYLKVGSLCCSCLAQQSKIYFHWLRGQKSPLKSDLRKAISPYISTDANFCSPIKAYRSKDIFLSPRYPLIHSGGFMPHKYDDISTINLFQNYIHCGWGGYTGGMLGVSGADLHFSQPAVIGQLTCLRLACIQ